MSRGRATCVGGRSAQGRVGPPPGPRSRTHRWEAPGAPAWPQASGLRPQLPGAALMAACHPLAGLAPAQSAFPWLQGTHTRAELSGPQAPCLRLLEVTMLRCLGAGIRPRASRRGGGVQVAPTGFSRCEGHKPCAPLGRLVRPGASVAPKNGTGNPAPASNGQSK